MSYTDEYMSGYRIGDYERISLATANSNLRHEVDKLNVEIERLRAAGHALVTVMQSGSDAGWDAAIDAWQEARRV